MVGCLRLTCDDDEIDEESTHFVHGLKVGRGANRMRCRQEERGLLECILAPGDMTGIDEAGRLSAVTRIFTRRGAPVARLLSLSPEIAPPPNPSEVAQSADRRRRNHSILTMVDPAKGGYAY